MSNGGGNGGGNDGGNGGGKSKNVCVAYNGAVSQTLARLDQIIGRGFKPILRVGMQAHAQDVARSRENQMRLSEGALLPGNAQWGGWLGGGRWGGGMGGGGGVRVRT